MTTEEIIREACKDYNDALRFTDPGIANRVEFRIKEGGVGLPIVLLIIVDKNVVFKEQWEAGKVEDIPEGKERLMQKLLFHILMFGIDGANKFIKERNRRNATENPT